MYVDLSSVVYCEHRYVVFIIQYFLYILIFTAMLKIDRMVLHSSKLEIVMMRYYLNIDISGLTAKYLPIPGIFHRLIYWDLLRNILPTFVSIHIHKYIASRLIAGNGYFYLKST